MSKYDWSEEHLRESVLECNCWKDWLRKLRISTVGGNYKTLKNKAKLYNIDTSHFNHIYAKTNNGKRIIKKMSDREFFNKSHNPTILKNGYIDRVLKIAKCESCGITEWNGKPIVFQLHHKDGNHNNNNVNNLQLLCPNCHSQTETFSNRKR